MTTRVLKRTQECNKHFDVECDILLLIEFFKSPKVNKTGLRIDAHCASIMRYWTLFINNRETKLCILNCDCDPFCHVGLSPLFSDITV